MLKRTVISSFRGVLCQIVVCFERATLRAFHEHSRLFVADIVKTHSRHQRGWKVLSALTAAGGRVPYDNCPQSVQWSLRKPPAFADDYCGNQCRDTGVDVNNSAAGKIHETPLGEPAATPDPVRDRHVNEE